MNAFAAHGNHWNGAGGWTVRTQDWLDASYARRDEAREQRQLDRRGGREARQFGEGQHPNGGVPGNANPEERRGGRMTPEERRALRRQIDEAGRDIYSPRR